MQLTCDRAEFSSAFQTAAAAVPSRTPKDVLRNVHLSIDGAAVYLVGTDQEIAVRALVNGVETNSAGEVLLPTARVSAILRELTDEKLELEADEKSLTLRTEGSRFRLSSEDPRDFPPVPAFEESHYFRIPGPVFSQMIRRTAFATDTESTRYALGGILVEIEDGTITLVATDSRRLALARAACETNGTPTIPEKTTVIPTKAMNLMERSIGPDTEYVDLAIRENDVLMRTPNCVIYSRLVEGRFPRYGDVIPPSSEIEVTIPAAPFLTAVRQAQIVTDEESRGVDFCFDDSVLTLDSRAGDIGESLVKFPVDYNGEAISITFDPRYVGDFLKTLPSDAAVHLKLNSPQQAALLELDESYQYVIMPLSRDR